MTEQKRTLICTLDHSFHNPAQGKVNVLYEKIDEVYRPINKTKDFCETSQVFITKGYEELNTKYKDDIFELIAKQSDNELKEGDCQYISTDDYATPVTSAFVCAEVIDAEVPYINKPTLLTKILPTTKTIFIRHDHILHGPFSISETNSPENENDVFELKIETRTIDIQSTAKQVTLPAYHYFKVDEDAVENELHTTSDGRAYVSNIRDVMMLAQSEDFVDFMSDETLVSVYGGIIAGNNQIRNFTKSHIRLIKEKVINLKQYRADKVRFDRLFDLFEMPEIWDRERSTIMNEYFESDKGKQTVTEYIKVHKDEILAGKLKDIQAEVNQKAEMLKETNSDLSQQKHNLEAEIRNLKEKKSNLENEDTQARTKLTEEERASLDAEFTEQQQKLGDVKIELEQLQIKYDQYKTVEELEKRRTDLSGAISLAEEDFKEAETQNAKIKKELETHNNDLLNELVGLKPKVEMLTGALNKESYKPRSFDTQPNFIPETYGVEEQQKVLENISDQLLTHGRKLDFEDLANVVICLAQSQFTLFSGLPGTGKTSLGKLLGKSMGLKNRLLNIPVARGWTSQRDVIGFYNALSQSYVPSATGLHDLLSVVQEKNDGVAGTTGIVLLDEFNLSQPEHYFSPFLEMADPESDRMLETGDPKNPQLLVPEYIRFLGTINNDESVQALTPRMLDRSAIIHFEDQVSSTALQTITPSDSNFERLTLNGNDFIKLFNNTNQTLPVELENTLDEITSVLIDDDPRLGSQIIVSYRKVKAITSYCNIATPLMINDHQALDFAVSQHVIPLIQGYGEGFGDRLKKLLSVIPNEMEKSRRRLNRIIIRGQQNLNNFGAFL